MAFEKKNRIIYSKGVLSQINEGKVKLKMSDMAFALNLATVLNGIGMNL